MSLLYGFLYFVLKAAGPALVAMAGITVLCAFVPRGSRMIFGTFIAIAAAVFVLVPADPWTSAGRQQEGNAGKNLPALCKSVGTRRYAELPASPHTFYLWDAGPRDPRKLEALSLQTDAKALTLVALDPTQAGPRSGYLVVQRRLPAPQGVFHGIFAVREAVTGQLIAERVYAYGAWQQGLENRYQHLDCGSDEAKDRPLGNLEEPAQEQLVTFLSELAGTKADRGPEVRLDLPYRELDRCAPLIRLSEEVSRGASLLKIRDGDDLVLSIYAPERPDEFTAYVAEVRRRQRAKVSQAWPTYTSKTVQHDLLRCKGYFTDSGAHAVPLLHAHGSVESVERVTRFATKRR